MNKKILFFILLVVLSSLLMRGNAYPIPLGTGKGEGEKEIIEKTSRIQIPFIANEGQISDEDVRFYAKTFGGTVYVTRGGELTYSMSMSGEKTKDRARDKHPRKGPMKVWTFKESLVNALNVKPHGMDKSQAKINYFIGNEKGKWKTDIATYNTVSLGEVYEGIVLSLKAYGNNIEKLFYIKPEANPEDIRLRFEGAEGINVNEKGELELKTELGVVKFTKPMAYQEGNGRGEYTEVAYEIKGKEYGFTVGNYDRTKELVIDPLLASTFLGGGYDDFSRCIAIDSSGNVYIAGYTESTADFPTTPGAYDTSYNYGDNDAFVSKFNGDLTVLLASTYLGGGNRDYPRSIAIDLSGNVYVVGYTESANFPRTSGAYDTSFNGIGVGFILKFDRNLTVLLASTYLGGGFHDSVSSMALDSGGNVYVAGITESSDFPTTPGAYDTSFNDPYCGFVSKLNGNLTTLISSTFIGNFTSATSILISSNGNIYVAGHTDTIHAHEDVFVSKFDSDLRTLLASANLGGGADDYATSMAIDSDGNIYVSGWTSSTDFPTTPGAYDTYYNGGVDAFVSKFNGDLTTLLSSTYLGGGGYSDDFANSIAVNSGGNVYVVGETNSSTFPTTPGAYDTSDNGGVDAFISKFNRDLTVLLASTYLGGGPSYVDNSAQSIALDSAGNVYVVGYTRSQNFPVTPVAYDTAHNGRADAFVVKFDPSLSRVSPNLPDISVSRTSINFGNINVGSSSVETVTVSNTGSANLTIGTITSPSSPFSKSADNCSGLSLSPSATCTITYRFSPMSEGTFSSNSNIPSNDPDENPVTITLTGTGVSLNLPDITVSPLSLSFGNVNVGSSASPQIVTIRNDGSANLSLGSIATTGTNASEFSKTADTCSGQVLTPGASCSLQVRFSPTSPGSKVATLSIPSNDPDENPVGVSLSGIGTTQQYTLTITKAGTGAGTVTSSPKGISCGTDCTEGYKPGTKLTLKAKADTNSTFTGWSGGGCSGTGSCVLTLDSDTAVTASFTIKTQPLKVKRKIINKGILVTYTIKGKGDNHLVLDLTLQNVARTWFQIRREGNLSVSDRDIPYVILLGPDGSISFNGIPFNRGEWLLLQASKAGSLGGEINPLGDENNLALAALSLDLFGRGLFGVVLPPNIFTSTQLNLLLNFAIAYKDPILENISIDLGKKLAKKGLPNLIVNLITWLGNLDLNERSTKEVIDELYQGLSHFADEWSTKIAEGFETILGIFKLPDHVALVWDLWNSTQKSPDGSSVEIKVE